MAKKEGQTKRRRQSGIMAFFTKISGAVYDKAKNSFIGSVLCGYDTLNDRTENGVIKTFDVKDCSEAYPEVNVVLENEELFGEVSVVPGGYGIEFDEELDIECDVLWEHGVEAKSPFDEFIAFTDAVKTWGLSESALRKAVANKKLIENIDAKNFGSQWVVTKTAMLREYGYPKVE